MLSGKFKFNKFFINLHFSNQVSENQIYEKEFDNIFNLIDIKMIAGDIEVISSTDDKIKIEVYSDKGSVNVDNTEVLKIKVNSKTCRGFCFNLKKDRVVIYLPEDYGHNIEIENKYGNTEIDDFANADISIDSSCGDVLISNGNKVSVRNNYGNTKVKDSKEVEIEEDCGDVIIGKTSFAKIKNAYGDIEIDCIEDGFLNVENDCGDIEIKELNIVKDSFIKNDFGDIKIGSTNEVYIDADTDLGDVEIKNNYRSSEITLEISNDCGDIEVKN